MQWSVALVALAVLGVAAVSRRLSGTPVTAAMVLVAIGVLIGPQVTAEVDFSPSSASVRTLAEATLALVLFADASRIRLRALRTEYVVPLRLLGLGLPLTIALGTLLAAVVFNQLTIAEALVLAVLLAPTDGVHESDEASRFNEGLGQLLDGPRSLGSARCCSDRRLLNRGPIPRPQAAPETCLSARSG